MALKLLVLGPLGPPHVEDQVLALHDRGFDIEVGGNALKGLEDTAMPAVGVPVHISPEARRATPWGISQTVSWTRRLISEVQPDVVQAHWLPSFGFAAAAAGARPLAVTAWGSDVHRASRAMRAASRFALKRADLVMADASDLLEGCIELGADPATAEIVQWGVDLSVFRPREDAERDRLKERLGIGPGPVILSPRSLMPVYNIPTILEAFAIAGGQLPDAQLLIKHMGEGSVQIDLPPIPHPDRVHLVGNVPYERMADYYAVADAVVSVTSSDGSPRSIWEAMGCAAPCILTDLPWVHDLIEPGVEALTVPVRDPDALAAAMLELVTDEGRRRSIGWAGNALVRRELDRSVQMDRLATLLSGLGSQPAQVARLGCAT